MEKTHKFIVPETDAAKRLDLFLTGKIPALTRSGIKNLLEEGRIVVNNKPQKAGYRIKPGDRVVATVPGAAPPEALPEAIPLDILYEDEDIIVVNKPAGLSVHPGAGRGSGTLVNALAAHTKDLSSIGGPERPGIVHRLDKDTTGSLVVAKNDHAHISLAKQFSAHTTGRKYLALVWGAVKDNEGTIDLAIGRDAVHRKKISPRARKKRAAVTRYRVKSRYPGFTLLELMPQTGRTHQLRVHLAAINHPIVGDQVYGKRKIPPNLPGPLADVLKNINRQLLHALTLRVLHPGKGTYMDFVAPLPPDMDEVIKTLEAEYKGG